MKKIFIKFFLIFSSALLLFFLSGSAASALQINFAEENFFSAKGVRVEGLAEAGAAVLAGIYDSNSNLIYSLRSGADENGRWTVNFDQPLKKGMYYIQAQVQNLSGVWSAPVRSDFINVRGPFALIVAIFSVLVIILTAIFVAGWYLSKRAEIKRYQRILISQRDVASAYNVMKNDVQKALEKISARVFDEGAASEVEFLLKKTDENLEKMDKYIAKGINVLSKYDIISKIDKVNKDKNNIK